MSDELQMKAAVERFLYDEAELLDARRFEEWLALFAEDATYEVPLRITREGQASELSEKGRIFSESKTTLGIRVQRLLSEYAWAEQPPSRTRHFVSNVRVDTGAAERITVRCNLLVYRNRGDDPSYDLYSADRRDELVAGSDGGFLVRRRWLAIDQSNMAGDSLSVFL